MNVTCNVITSCWLHLTVIFSAVLSTVQQLLHKCCLSFLNHFLRFQTTDISLEVKYVDYDLPQECLLYPEFIFVCHQVIKEIWLIGILMWQKEKLISLLKVMKKAKILFLDSLTPILNIVILRKDSWGRKVVWGYSVKAGFQPVESLQGLRPVPYWLMRGLVVTFLIGEGSETCDKVYESQELGGHSGEGWEMNRRNCKIAVSLGLWFSECGPWTNSFSITWEVVRNANFQISTPSGTLWVGPSN